MSSVDINSDNYYTVLGIDKSAKNKEIKKVFMKLSAIHHPDKGGVKEDFHKIKKAYDVLIDVDSRAFYDKHGIFKDNEENNSRGYLISLVTSMLNKIQDIGTFDIVSELRKITYNNIDVAERNIEKENIMIDRINKNKRRAKGGIILHVFNTKLGLSEQNKKNNEINKRMFELSLTLIDDLVYDNDEPPPPPQNSGAHIVYVTG